MPQSCSAAGPDITATAHAAVVAKENGAGWHSTLAQLLLQQFTEFFSPSCSIALSFAPGTDCAAQMLLRHSPTGTEG